MQSVEEVRTTVAVSTTTASVKMDMSEKKTESHAKVWLPGS